MQNETLTAICGETLVLSLSLVPHFASEKRATTRGN